MTLSSKRDVFKGAFERGGIFCILALPLDFIQGHIKRKDISLK